MALAQQLAARGQFPLFLQACQRIADEAAGNATALQSLGLLYAAHGFIGHARACYAQVRELQPHEVGVLANVANAARDAGDHAQARRVYTELLERLPNHPLVRRDYLVGLEYDPDAPGAGAGVVAGVFRHHGVGIDGCGATRCVACTTRGRIAICGTAGSLAAGPLLLSAGAVGARKRGAHAMHAYRCCHLRQFQQYGQQVLELWTLVLAAVPQSRLVLKWRTFNDDAFRAQVVDTFVQRGIEAERIELRGPGFHSDVLKEYADIDIALDTFPFTGGLTSCEALWMGVPVVTWPQTRVVSRQTHAFLHQIGLPELSASDANDYLRIAVSLAGNVQRLASLRAGLRKRMQGSSLMNVNAFTRGLEEAFEMLMAERSP